MIRLIAAIDRSRGLAKNGGLPWHIPEDEAFFTRQTKSLGGHVLSGRSTFVLTYHKRPLIDRHNYILTRSAQPIDGAEVVNDIGPFLDKFKTSDLWVAGGAQVFKEVMDLDRADELYLTKIEADFGCDKFFPDYEKTFKLIDQSDRRQQNGFYFRYCKYVRS